MIRSPSRYLPGPLTVLIALPIAIDVAGRWKPAGVETGWSMPGVVAAVVLAVLGFGSLARHVIVLRTVAHYVVWRCAHYVSRRCPSGCSDNG